MSCVTRSCRWPTDHVLPHCHIVNCVAYPRMCEWQERKHKINAWISSKGELCAGAKRMPRECTGAPDRTVVVALLRGLASLTRCVVLLIRAGLSPTPSSALPKPKLHGKARASLLALLASWQHGQRERIYV